MKETLIAMAIICGGGYLLMQIALDAPPSGYRPSREEILTQCEQIEEDDLLDKCFDAANKARK